MRAVYVRKQEVPIDPPRDIHVERGGVQGVRHSGNHARPFDAELVDQRPAEEGGQKAHDVVEAVGQVREPGRRKAAAAEVRDGVHHRRADEREPARWLAAVAGAPGGSKSGPGLPSEEDHLEEDAAVEDGPFPGLQVLAISQRLLRADRDVLGVEGR